MQSLETASGKAEQIGFYNTVLGDPVGAFRASRLIVARRVRTLARCAALLGRGAAPSSKCTPKHGGVEGASQGTT